MNRFLGGVVPTLLCSACVGSAGVIRGTVTVPNRVPAAAASMNAYPGRASAMPNMHMPPRGLPGDAILYVERVPAAVESVLAQRPTTMPRLAQKDQCFVPRVIVIATGSKVDFPNQDPIYHNVFSFSPTRRFDLGKYPRGNSRQVL